MPNRATKRAIVFVHENLTFKNTTDITKQKTMEVFEMITVEATDVMDNP
jgi:hypothetical protein